jgi:hypothetical protein
MPSGWSLADAVVDFHRTLQIVPTGLSWYDVRGDAWYPGWLEGAVPAGRLPLNPLSALPIGASPTFDTLGSHVEAALLTFTLVSLYREPGRRAPSPGMFVLPVTAPRFPRLMLCGKSFLSVASHAVGVGDVEVNVPGGPSPGVVQYFTSVELRVHVDGTGYPCLPSDPMYVETIDHVLTLARMRWYQTAPMDASKPSFVMWTDRYEPEKLVRRGARGPVVDVSKHAKYAFVPIHRVRNMFVKLTTADGLRFAVGRVPQFLSY